MAKSILLPILYLLSGVMIVPGAALAWFGWAVGSVANQKDLIHALVTALIQMVQGLYWAMFGAVPLLIVWLVLAFVVKYRWLGAGGMGLVAVATLVLYVVTMGFQRMVTEGDWFSGMVSVGLAINVWIVWDAWA